MLYITMVMYNKSISDIMMRDVMKKLLEHHGEGKVRLVIVDNSDKAYLAGRDEELNRFVSESGIIYIQSGENLGLSKAYNMAIRYALHESASPKNDFMLFLDDDTEFRYDYIREIYLQAKAPEREHDGVNVLAGIISSGGRPMSPTKCFKMKYFENDYISEPGTYKDICCINSGMAVRLDSLEKVGGFEESLFLDMIDYMLMYRLSQHDLNKVLVVDQRAQQRFSGREKSDRNVQLARFRIYQKDFNKFCELTGRSKGFARLNLLKRRIAIDIKSK